MTGSTFEIPLTNSWNAIKDLSPGVQKADRWIEVPARSSGVPGLVVTARSNGRLESPGYVEGEWVLTQRSSGRVLGATVFPSIAAARRAAARIADLADWTDPELIYEWIKPSSKERILQIREALRAEL